MTHGPARPSVWMRLLYNRPAALGLLIATSLTLTALAAPLLPLAPPADTALAERLLPPLADGHLLGTDHLGRDLFSRLIWGTRTSIAVGLSASLIAALIGSLIGLVAGFAGGRTDSVLMRGIDMLMAFPYVLLALAIVAVLGPGLQNALYAIAVVNIPFFARTIRGVTLGLARQELIDAARLSGKGPAAILFTEILPNVMPVIVITLSTTLGWMILETAGLSFLGLGAQPPLADLGSMLGEGRRLLFNAPHVSIIPGLAIFLLVMSVNLVGDGIRDALDPRLKSGALRRPGARTLVDRSADAGVKQAATSGESAETVLQVRDLNTVFRFGRSEFTAVSALNLEIGAGECLGLVGESGCGKSVTAMSLTGLAPSPPAVITGGQVWFQGHDLVKVSDSHLRALRGGAIAHVFQDPLSALHPLFTIGEQITESLRAHQPIGRREARLRALDLLDLVRIPNPVRRLNAYPHELSGGMRQRVCIAMALANDARLLIADEPTTALDVTVQARVLALLDRLRRERGTSLLFISHDLGVISQISDRTAVMYAGGIVEIGPTAQVLTSPRHPYTRMLIDCVPEPGASDQRLPVIQGAPPAPEAMPPGCAFVPRCPRAEDACNRTQPPWSATGPARGVRCLYPVDPTLADHNPAPGSPPRSAGTRGQQSRRRNTEQGMSRRPNPGDGASDPVLSVRGVGKRFRVSHGSRDKPRAAVHAVEDLDLDMRLGETLGIVGESGCGKTTLARLLVGLEEPSAGRIELLGEDLGALRNQDPQRVAAIIQYVFQDPLAALNPRKRVREILDAPLRLLARLGAADRRARYVDLMEAVGLDATHLERYPHELSGGQAQRVGIARALAANPRILVLDEPVSALDLSVQAQVLNLLTDLQRDLGLSFCLISHDLGVVERVSDRVAVMYFGRVVELGPRERIYQAPSHPYTRLLLASIPVPGRTLQSDDDAEAQLPDPFDPPPGCAFAGRCPLSDARCSAEQPALSKVSDGHRVACFRAH